MLRSHLIFERYILVLEYMARKNTYIASLPPKTGTKPKNKKEKGKSYVRQTVSCVDIPLRVRWKAYERKDRHQSFPLHLC